MPYENLVWSCLPQALTEYRALCLSMGPVEDAERAGLNVRKIGQSAVIGVKGVLLRSAPRWAIAGGYASSYRDIQAGVAAAAADKDVEQIIPLINSPGGSVSGVDEAADAIAQAAKIKPVIVQVEGQMASAAYYLGSQGTEIRAGRGDMIGSIGTRLVVYDTSKMADAAGIKVLAIDSGEYKSAGEPGTVVTDNHIRFFQDIVDAYQAQFAEVVKSGRLYSRKEFDYIADGRMWLAEDARDLRLIDTVMTVDQTIADAASGVSTSRRTTAHLRQQMLEQRSHRAAAHPNHKRATP
jgi:signal peptide peptidase SppA